MESYAPWQIAARGMIADACLAEYRKVNSGRKRHVPYAIPEWCRPMIDALEANDETETKRLMHVVRIGALTLI